MKKFDTLESIPAYLPIVNIDTDMIIPKQFLKTIKRTGLGKNLFFEMRYDENGKEIKNFILNNEPYTNSKILITGKNFGCGSSREHAPWALRDFGFKVLIAPSFADIFFNNSIKNGLLLVTLSEMSIQELFQLATLLKPLKASIDLVNQTIETNSKGSYQFKIEASVKQRLLDGADDISLTLNYKEDIRRYEEMAIDKHPWRFV